MLPFLPAALREYAHAVAWYAREDAALGEDFAAEVGARLERAEKMPGAGTLEVDAPTRFELRWYGIKRFPYALLVGVADDQRIVVALAHERRRPGYWKHRLVKLSILI